MTKALTNSEADSGGLARLMAIGIQQDAGDTPPAASKAELLRAALSAVLPRQADQVDALLEIVGRMCREFSDTCGLSLERALLDPETELLVLKATKSHAKQQSREAQDDARQAIWAAVYFAAIASALRFHRARISSMDTPALKAAFEELAAKSWMPRQLAEHFAKVAQLCDN